MDTRPTPELDQVPEIAPHHRLQWEPVPQAYVLLYPEGRVQLNQSAGEILRRIDGKATIAGIIDELQLAFHESDLRTPVLEALAIARQQGWVRVKTHEE